MIAIIPARGGSKGLPGKNIKLLNGLPLISYSIKAALKSKHIERVIVSTDSKEIAEIAIYYGAEVPFLRPEYLATDESLSIDNFIYSIERLEELSNHKIENFIVLQPTSPLRNTQHIDEAIDLFISKNADSVISYTKEAHPITWHKYVNNDLRLKSIFEEDIKNRQDYRVSYFPNGAIYVFSSNLIRSRNYSSDKTYAFIMPSSHSIDIDTQYDFDYAEFQLSKDNNELKH